MSEIQYTFNEMVTLDQVLIIMVRYNQQPFDRRPKLEVYARICELLYLNGFKGFHDGMYNRETNCHLDWETLMQYKTVADFQVSNGFVGEMHNPHLSHIRPFQSFTKHNLN